jgi:hypothetical protein
MTFYYKNMKDKIIESVYKVIDETYIILLDNAQINKERSEFLRE